MLHYTKASLKKIIIIKSKQQQTHNLHCLLVKLCPCGRGAEERGKKEIENGETEKLSCVLKSFIISKEKRASVWVGVRCEESGRRGRCNGEGAASEVWGCRKLSGVIVFRLPTGVRSIIPQYSTYVCLSTYVHLSVCLSACMGSRVSV